MILTENNLTEWKTELKKEASERMGIKDYDGCLSDEEYLEDYIGEDTKDVIMDSISYLI